MASLFRTQHVLHALDPDSSGAYVAFTRELDEPNDLPMMVLADRGIWNDFANPHTITVTIEPGDKLNVQND